MPPAFSDSTERGRALGLLEPLHHRVAHAARQTAVVALDRLVELLGEVGGELHAPLGEVREHEHALAGREHRLDDLLEPRQLAAAPLERTVVVLVRGGVVADLLERGDGGEDLALARLLALGQVVGEHQPVEHGLVETDLLGGHRAVVELVDLVGQLGLDLGLRLGAAEHEDAVERAQRVLGRGAPGRTTGDAAAVLVARQAGDELRPRTDQPGVGEVEDGPEVAEAVLDRRAGERDARARRRSGAAAARSRWCGS